MNKPVAVRRQEQMAPGEGFEPPTNRLTAGRSTTELPRKGKTRFSEASAAKSLSIPLARCQLRFSGKGKEARRAGIQGYLNR